MTNLRRALSFVAILCTLTGGGSLVHAQQASPTVWPAPPESARVAYRQSVTSMRDLGVERSFLRRVWEFLLGESASEPTIVQPLSVAADRRGRIYVADPGAACVHIFDPTGKSYRSITSNGSGQLRWPVALAFGPGETIFVSDAVNREVVVFTATGEAVRRISGSFQRPTGIAIVGGMLYVVDSQLHCIFAMSLEGNDVHVIGSRGTGPGQFNSPVFVTGLDDVVVVDAMNHRIQRLSCAGEPLLQFGSVGNVQGTFANPKGVAVDRRGNIYVSDALFDAVQIFNRHGELLLVVGRSGRGPGEFLSPSGLWIDQSDRLYVADAGNRRIQVFDLLIP